MKFYHWSSKTVSSWCKTYTVHWTKWSVENNCMVGVIEMSKHHITTLYSAKYFLTLFTCWESFICSPFHCLCRLRKLYLLSFSLFVSIEKALYALLFTVCVNWESFICSPFHCLCRLRKLYMLSFSLFVSIEKALFALLFTVCVDEPLAVSS